MGDQERSRQRFALLSLGIGLSLLAVKFYAAGITGSKAIFSDALESIVNVVAASVVVLSIRIANEPADENHPFGHGRVEALSAGLEGALLLAAAGGIMWAAIPAFFDPRPLESTGVGLALVALATLVNFVVGRLLIRAGRRHHSMALVADGRHLLGDAVSSVALLLGVGAVWITGIAWLDPLVAVLLGGWVGWSGVGVIVEAVRSLMNEQRMHEVEQAQQALDEAAPDGVLDTYDLRILNTGTERFIHLRIRVPKSWSLLQAHDLSRRVEALLRDAFEGRVTAWVKVEP